MRPYNKWIINYISQLIEKDPQLVIGYINKGVSLEKLNRLNEALIEYDKALDLDSNCLLAHYNKGNIYLI
jgi:tetratricopeptide (TPR) repeat protein